MKLKIRFITAAMLLLALCGCRTTEENYRAAYNTAKEARLESGDSIESTIYGRERLQAVSRSVETPSGTFEVRTALIRVTKDGGGIRENLRQYSGVVGQFKQLFNAKSMRERLVEAGYPSAFVVETGEPYYYVILKSEGNINTVAEALAKFKQSGEIPMLEPCPFIIDAASVKRQYPVQKRG